MSWMKDFAGKLSRERHLMMSFCPDNCLMEEQILLLDQYGKFVGRDFDSDVLSNADPDILLTFALKVLNLNSNTTGDGEVRAGARTLKAKVAVA